MGSAQPNKKSEKNDSSPTSDRRFASSVDFSKPYHSNSPNQQRGDSLIASSKSNPLSDLFLWRSPFSDYRSHSTFEAEHRGRFERNNIRRSAHQYTTKSRYQEEQHVFNPLTRSDFCSHHYGAPSVSDVYDIQERQDADNSLHTFSHCTHRITQQKFGLYVTQKRSQPAVAEGRVEAAIRRQIDHPSVVNTVETFEDARCIYTVVELCKGPDLMTLLATRGSFSEPEASKIMRWVFSAVAYMHSKNVAIRGVAPEHFRFVDESNILGPLKLTHFSLARFAHHKTVFTRRVGNLYCIAPQVLRGTYTRRCDDWSCGVLLFNLLLGCPPVFGETEVDVLQHTRKSFLIRPTKRWKTLSPEARTLITALLASEEEKRLSCCEALETSWMRLHAPSSCSPELAFQVVNRLELSQTATDATDSSYSYAIDHKINAFARTSRLKQAALVIIARHVPMQRLRAVEDLFTLLDITASGFISLHEVVQELERLSNSPLLPYNRSIVLCPGTQESLSYTVFLAATLDRSIFIRDENLMRLAFLTLDKNNEGYLTFEVLSQYQWLGGNSVASSTRYALIQDMIRQVDIDGDREINFEEFILMMQMEENDAERPKDKRRSRFTGVENNMFCLDYPKRRNTIAYRSQHLERLAQMANEAISQPKPAKQTRATLMPTALDKFREFQTETLSTIL